MDRRLLALMGALAFVTLAVGVSAIDARATYGARVTADEPQYLTTALSLGEDFDLDISDELEERRFLPYHEISLNPQTLDLNDAGQRISPHDPLLPLVLALPMRWGGWVAAKVALAAIAGLTAAATLWVAVRRAGVSENVGAVVVGAAFVSPPLTAYATQVYPEMPAALATVIGVGALSGERMTARCSWITSACIVALPWLGIKYFAVALVLAVALLARLWRNRSQAVMQVGALAIAGIVYLVVHRRVYGGWTVYASGDHFIDGEFLVVGHHANYTGRTRRLLGLFIDRGFGLIAWAPAFVVAPGALLLLLRSRTRLATISLWAVAGGYATATWVALTMHGWWWPGRQLVVVLPLIVIAMTLAADRARVLVWPITLGFLVGTFSWLWLVIEASTDRRTLIFDFQETADPLYGTWRQLLPDHRQMSSADIAGTAAWGAILGLIAVWMWRSSPSRGAIGDRGDDKVTR